MRHAQEGVELGIGCREGAVGVLRHANSQTDDVDGSTTAVVAVMRPPNVCEVNISGALLLAAVLLKMNSGGCALIKVWVPCADHTSEVASVLPGRQHRRQRLSCGARGSVHLCQRGRLPPFSTSHPSALALYYNFLG